MPFSRFLYKDEADITEDHVLGILYLSNKYMVGALTDLCTAFLANQIDEENVCMMLELAKIYNAAVLEAKCLDYITSKATFVLKSDGFFDVHQSTLLQILKLDVLNAREEDILKAALDWAETECHRQQLEPSPSNQRHVLGDVFYALRLPCLRKEELDELIANSGILTDEEILMLRNYQESRDGVDQRIPQTSDNDSLARRMPFVVEKRRRSLSDSTYCELLKSASKSVVFSNRMNLLECVAPDDLNLHCVEVLDLSTTSHTVKVTVNVIQNERTLCQYGVKIGASRAVNHLGCIVPVHFPNPPLVTKGAFQIGVTYRFVGGSYGTVPCGVPHSTDIECGGIMMSFPEKKPCHVAGLELGWAWYCRRHYSLKILPWWWRHQMETFYALLAFCEGNPSVTGGFP